MEEIELRRLRLPLVRAFRTAHGTTTAREILLVRIRAEDGEGWGECAAEATPTYWYETVETAALALRAWLVPDAAVVGHPMARAALEMARLDLELRRRGIPLSQHLSWLAGEAARELVPACATLGVGAGLGAVDDTVAAGYRAVKLKLDGPADADLAAAVARRHPGVAVAADANGSLGGATKKSLRALDAAGLDHLEQPLDADDLTGHARLREWFRTPVCLDESVTSPGTFASALALGAVGAVTVKASRLGGLAQAVEVYRAATAAEVPAKVGGMLETGIGRAAALALAALPGFTLPADLAASERYWAEDLTEPFVLDGEGCLAVPSGPGLGVTVRTDYIDAVTESIERISSR